MEQNFHENTPHGTPSFPLQVYSHHDINGFYFVCQHWHEELEWIYVEKGTLDLTIHGQFYTLHAGQFCFINSEELHGIRSEGASLHHAIVFRADFLDFSFYDICQHNFIQPITKQKVLFPSICPNLLPKTSSQILEHMQQIITLYHSKPKCASLSIKLHILHILELLYQSDVFYENDMPIKENISMNRLKNIVEYIQAHYMDSLSLQTLADLAYMSPNYFCAVFRKELGKTPVTFINEFRIQKAAQLLANSDLSISQISEQIGFNNFSYFIRKFREYKKISPSQYRNLLKSECKQKS